MYARSGQAGTEREAVEWAKEAADRGAGEILLTSIDRDGTKSGFDCELTAAVSRAVPIPVIASGGAGSLEHFAEVFVDGCADAALAASIFHFSEHAVRDLKSMLHEPRHSGAALDMLIPAIDLKGGKVVQLIQGEKLAIETTDLDYWIGRFSGFRRVNVIDLDAAMNSGSNDHLVREICTRLPCQVGGGVRSPERAAELCAIGAKKVIVGSALFKDGVADSASAQRFADAVGVDRVDRRGRQQGAAGSSRTGGRRRPGRRPSMRCGRSNPIAASFSTRTSTRKA